MGHTHRSQDSRRDAIPSLSAKKFPILMPILTALILSCANNIEQTRLIASDTPFNEINSADFAMRVSTSSGDRSFEPGKVVICVGDALFMAKPEGIDAQTSDELTHLLRERLYWNLLKDLTGRAIITRDPNLGDYLTLGYRAVRLQTAITSLQRGVGVARYIVGYGLGDAVVQVEGRLIDQRTNKWLAEFALRVHHNGYPSWGWNPRALSARHCWRLALDEAAQHVSKNLASLLFP
jgi:hypothetical protein